MVAGAHQGQDGQQLGGMAGAGGEAPTPPSRSATRCSSTSVVGFMMRV